MKQISLTESEFARTRSWWDQDWTRFLYQSIAQGEDSTMKNIICAASGILSLGFCLAVSASEERAGVLCITPSPSPSGQEVVFASDLEGPES